MTVAAPSPKELAVQLRSLASALDQHGHRALELAPLLAARGWPTTTMPSGSRGNSELTSVEAAADNPNVDWDNVDQKLDAALHRCWVDILDVRTLITNITSHAGADDRKTNQQPGSGDCLVCSKYVPGTAEDRLRAGYCNACRMAWVRADRPDRVMFQRTHRRFLDAETAPARVPT